MSVLVIVPCGRSKVWERDPLRGPTRAREVYTGAPFVLNRDYAERFGDAWVILSAKYGFIAPDFVIPEAYEVSFKYPATNPIALERLHEQRQSQNLDRFGIVVGLGGKEYRAAIEEAFAGTPVQLIYPFAGLPIGKTMQATKRAIASGEPGFSRADG